jgi:hypothetical protein|tara:strand:+ start:508 stop:1245 length:738 start_codon:yes stop_codon:yes gene_type:complete
MSTYSTGLRTELQVTGENSGTWGTITNNNFSQVFEFAIAGVYAVPAITTGTSTTLTNADGPQTQAANQARNNQLIFTGTVSTAHTVQFPATQKTYGIYNNIAGGAAITARLGATGNTVSIANGKYRMVATDGTNWYDIFSLAGLGEAWIEKDNSDSPYTASDGENIFVDCSAAAVTITLPASPTIGQQVKIIDGTGSAGTNNITVGRNSQNIQGSAADLTISTNSAGISLVFYDASNGWRLKYND